MEKRLILVAVLLTALIQPVPARVAVVLVDGRTLEGEDLNREGEEYELTTGPGEVVVIPAEFVSEVRLEQPQTEEKEPPEKDPDAWRHESGVIKGEVTTIAGMTPSADAPTGMNQGAKPEVLAGVEVTPSTPAEQTKVLGPPAKFQKGIFNERWYPSSDWDMTNGVNDWAPSKWSKGIVDPDWKPDSAYTKEGDQLEKHKSTWQPSIIDPDWHPKSGFATPNEGGS